MEYNIHGDTVNTAAWLESFAKDRLMLELFSRPSRILIGETTLAYLNDRFQTEQVGHVQLKGKDQHVAIFRVLGYKNTLPPQTSPHFPSPLQGER